MPALELRTPRAAAGRLAVLDELKGVAIILILLYHAGGVLVWNNYLHGDVGVDIFLLLSGLGLALGARTESAGAFFRRRVVRLMPAYWVVLAVYVLANTHFLQHHYSPLNLAAHALGVHALFGDAIGLGINDSFWFVTTILFLYGAFWLLHPLLDRLDRAVFWMGLISAAVAFAFFFTGQSGLMGHVGFRVPAFFTGMIAGHLLKNGRIELPLNAWSGVGLACFAYVPYTRGITFYSTFVALGLMALYAHALRPRLAANNPAVRGLDFFGRHSLEIFLIHQPLMREYNYYLHGRWLNEPSPSAASLAAGMALAIGVTVLASIELHRLQRVVFKA